LLEETFCLASTAAEAARQAASFTCSYSDLACAIWRANRSPRALAAVSIWVFSSRSALARSIRPSTSVKVALVCSTMALKVGIDIDK